MVAGIDISRKNGHIDWTLLYGSDVHFVFIQASEAINSVDPNYTENAAGAEKAGLLYGFYHWLHPRLHVGQQAELFSSLICKLKRSLPPVVCLEKHHAPVNEMEKNVRSFLVLIEKKIGMKPIIYTSEEYWRRFLSESDWGCEYHLWLDKPGVVLPQQIYPWSGWTFWQQSYQERIPGVQNDCGINWFNGSLKELKELATQI